MSGSRTKTGCYTCRIRKKKCDEQRPICRVCGSRDIHCYGYGEPPAWMQGKHSRDEILNTKEALEIRLRAEEAYKARRKRGLARKNKAQPASNTEDLFLLPMMAELEALSNDGFNRSKYPQLQNDESFAYPSPKSSAYYETSDTIILKPKDQKFITPPISPPSLEPIWWDSALCASFTSPEMSRNDARQLMIFMDIIFPLQFGFYPISTSIDRSWLLSNILSSQPYLYATLGISSCFESGQSQGVELGVTTQVRELQTVAIQGLQNDVDLLGKKSFTPKELLKRAVQTLSTMNQLLSLEVFSVIVGHWELHLQAARTLLGMIQAKFCPEVSTDKEFQFEIPSIEKFLLDSSLTDDRKALDLQITCFVWVDILAAATHGPRCAIPHDFNYHSLLSNGTLKTEKIMGCQSCVMLLIAEITNLEDWIHTQVQNHSLSTLEQATRASHIANHLIAGIEIIEQTSAIGMTSLQADSNSVTLIFAYAALVYLHTVVSGAYSAVPDIAFSVTRFLERLEALPSRLTIRICWPYAIAGCMANEHQYDKFREVVPRTKEHGKPLGLAPRSLMVMEECWRLREIHAQAAMAVGWREAMRSLGVRMLLI